MNTTTKTRSLTTSITLFGSFIAGVNAGDIQTNSGDFESSISTPKLSSNQQFTQGDWLLGFSGSYNRIEADGDSANVLYADVDFSYFIKDNWSLGISTFGLLIPEGGEVEDTGYAIGLEPNLRYYFKNESKYTPYVGVHAGYAYASVADESESISTYGLHAGVLFPLTESAYFDTKLKWSEYNLPDEADIDLSTLQLLVGFKIKF